MEKEESQSFQLYDYRDEVVLINWHIQEMILSISNKKPFKSDKYIDLATWFTIMENIDGLLKKLFDSKIDWKDVSKYRHLFDIGGHMKLRIKFKCIPKDESLINVEKYNCKLDWILVVKIFNDINGPPTISKRSSDTTASSSKSSDIETLIESHQIQKENKTVSSQKSERYESIFGKNKKAKPLRISDENDKQSPKPCPAEIINDDAEVITLEDSQEIIHEQKRIKVELRSQSQKELKMKKTVSLDGWLTSNDAREQTMAKNVTCRKKAKKVDPPTKSASRSELIINSQQMQSIQSILEKEKKIEEEKEIRKEQLKDVEILNCSKLSHSELREIVNSQEKKILELLGSHHQPRTNEIIDGLVFDCLMITTAHILTDDQQLYVLSQIEKLRSKEEVGSRLDTLHEVILPYMIVTIFSESHQMTLKDALERIKLQEEKKKLSCDNLHDSL